MPGFQRFKKHVVLTGGHKLWWSPIPGAQPKSPSPALDPLRRGAAKPRSSGSQEKANEDAKAKAFAAAKAEAEEAAKAPLRGCAVEEC